MFVYLAMFRYFTICFCLDSLDYSSVTGISKQDWKYTPYGIWSEELPLYAPEAKGKPIVPNHYFDANLMHDILSGKAVTGTIHFWNKTPMDWYSKKQSTSETATYGFKFLSCWTCFEQAIYHQNYPISYAWGDNKLMINSATNPDARIHKRHNILSFHFVWNIIAAEYINLQHPKSHFNLTDVASKHWSYQIVCDGLLKSTFYFEGDTGHLWGWFILCQLLHQFWR